MSPEKFDSLVQKVTKQFGDWCTKNKVYQWDKQKEQLNTLLIRNKLLLTDDSAEFWRAAGSTCDYMDDAAKKLSVKDWKWQTDVVFCILYMGHCIRRPKAKAEKQDEFA